MDGGRSLLVASCMLAALIAGCGSGSEEPAHTATAPATAAPAPAISAREQRRAEERERRAARRRLEATYAPNPYPPPKVPPAHPDARVPRTVVTVVKRGRGPEVRRDDKLMADYMLVWHRYGRLASLAWKRGRTEFFSVAQAAPAMRRGLLGMRPGERRTILMPRHISDVHDPDGEGWEIGYVDVVLRAILPHE